jgi:hypothetical protein
MKEIQEEDDKLELKTGIRMFIQKQRSIERGVPYPARRYMDVGN